MLAMDAGAAAQPAARPDEGPMYEGVRKRSGRGRWARVVMWGIYVMLVLNPLTALLLFWLAGEEAVRELAQTPLSAEMLWMSLALSLAGNLGLTFLFLWLARPGEDPLRLLGIDFSRRAIPYAVLGAGLGVLAMLLVWIGIDFLLPDEPEGAITIDLIRQNPIFVLAIPLVAAVGEEVLFRGLLQRRIGLWPTSLLFGVAHYAGQTPWVILVTGGVGLLFGFLYRRTRTLWTPIAAHFAYNLALLGVVFV